jgi:trans-aconitate methyltransferase
MDLDLDLTVLTPLERDEVDAYLRYHGRRFALLCETVAGLVGQRAARILDVGPNLQTALLRKTMPRALVDTMGFAHPLVPPRERERHIELDLNDAAWNATGGGDEHHDVVVLAEVIEHLHAPPELVLGYLSGWLPSGGTLVVQTPNAVALHKRLRMLRGVSPFEPIRLSRENPGHLHEYTRRELDDAARRAGLQPAGAITANYFGEQAGATRAYAALGHLLPPSLRHGITAWYRRPAPRTLDGVDI